MVISTVILVHVQFILSNVHALQPQYLRIFNYASLDYAYYRFSILLSSSSSSSSSSCFIATMMAVMAVMAMVGGNVDDDHYHFNTVALLSSKVGG